MSYAVRNRQIKKVLEQAFGKGRVSVRGARGTAYGWVSIDVDWTPFTSEQCSRMRTEVFNLLEAAKIDLGTCYSDDTCQWTMSRCHLNFNHSKYHQAKRLEDGSLMVQRDYMGEWQHVAA